MTNFIAANIFCALMKDELISSDFASRVNKIDVDCSYVVKIVLVFHVLQFMVSVIEIRC